MRGAFGNIAAGIVFISLPSACGQMASDRLEIVNKSGSLLTDVRATFSGNKVTSEDIEDNKSVTVDGSAPRDGVIILEYTQNGKPSRYEVTYIAPPIRTDCRVTILQNDIKRECATR